MCLGAFGLHSMCLLSQWWHAGPHTVHAHLMSRSSCSLNESWPSSRNSDWKMCELVLIFCLSVLKMAACQGRGLCAVVKGMWLAPIEILWHKRQNSRPMLSFPHARKMNYRRCWRCFTMLNCQLPMKNTYWGINPARCSKCHFTPQWARTSFK